MEIKTKKILLLIFDILIAYFSLFLALLIRYRENFAPQIFLKHFFPFSILYFLWFVVFYIFGLYDFESFKKNLFAKTIGALSLNFILGVFFFYFVPILKIAPKTILILNCLIFGILLFGWRKTALSFFSVYLTEKIAILGEKKEVEELEKEIEKRPYLGYKLERIDLEQNIIEQVKNKEIKTIVFDEKLEKEPKFLEFLLNSLNYGINFVEFRTFYERIFEKIPIFKISKIWFLENLKEGEKQIYDKFKRILDIIFGAIILVLTLPFWILIAMAIKLEDRGPVFYLQERVGKNKKIFKLIKFRSMVKEAEKEGPKWAEIEDQRVTKVGKFLRRFHLDEIPQMINVIRGDISLVGPRPERPEFVEKLEKEIPYYNLRHIIKPGFTGWAQIKFRYARSVMDSLEKFQYDLYYIKNRSLFLDLKILLKTFQLFFKKE
jgi:exopolysaccharide biosynthesis polyprenyl glycosylphosphotransferase